MPIEFRCPACGKLLRTPEDAAGRQARCPHCGGVCDVPRGDSAGGFGWQGNPQPSPLPSDGGGNPFSAPVPHGAPPDASAAEFNPYQSPAVHDETVSAGYDGDAGGLRPTQMDLGDVFARAWETYQLRMGITIGGVLLYFVVYMGVNFAQSGVSVAARMSLPPTEAVLVDFGSQIVLWLVELWLGLGLFLFVLRIARGDEPSLADLFAGGRYFLPTLAATLLLGLAVAALFGVCLAPAGLMYAAKQDEDAALIAMLVGMAVAVVPVVVVSLMFGQFQALIVDHEVGAIEALRLSKRITAGNKLYLFVLGLVVLAINLVGALACLVGLIFTGPFTVLLTAVAYLAMTGQPTAADAYRRPVRS